MIANMEAIVFVAAEDGRPEDEENLGGINEPLLVPFINYSTGKQDHFSLNYGINNVNIFWIYFYSQPNTKY